MKSSPAFDALLDPTLGHSLISAPSGDLTEIARYVDEFLRNDFYHIPVFQSFPNWKPISVNPNIEDFRVGGTGLIPPHIDFVNASAPPDLVVFYCENAYEFGGGRSIISNKADILNSLDKEEQKSLKFTYIQEGKFFNLDNVGVELNPFPLLDKDFLRFTGKKLRENVDLAERKVLEKIEKLAILHSKMIKLQSGDILLINQRHCLHGREPLLPNELHTFDLRRSLQQRFYRIIE